MSQDLIASFKLMGVGMLGIFIALGVIYLATVGLMKFFPAEDEDKDE